MKSRCVTDETFAECWSLDQTGNWKKYLQDDDGDGTWDLNQSRTANTVNEITDITESTGPSWVTPAGWPGQTWLGRVATRSFTIGVHCRLRPPQKTFAEGMASCACGTHPILGRATLRPQP